MFKLSESVITGKLVLRRIASFPLSALITINPITMGVGGQRTKLKGNRLELSSVKLSSLS